jgi:hypothetical protein
VYIKFAVRYIITRLTAPQLATAAGSAAGANCKGRARKYIATLTASMLIFNACKALHCLSQHSSMVLGRAAAAEGGPNWCRQNAPKKSSCVSAGRRTGPCQPFAAFVSMCSCHSHHLCGDHCEEEGETAAVWEG